MLKLHRLEIEGFGPYADRQTIDFPTDPGVTVIYGENMRGKTSLLNAIRFAFFGRVQGRGSRQRKLHSIVNDDLAKMGRHKFSVSLVFDFDGQVYELIRTCSAKKPDPIEDHDYNVEVFLQRGRSILGPDQRDHLLSQAFPEEVSRFFLFDGELLQEYEELLYNDSLTGPKISEAIERILGVPILKKGRQHLSELAEEANRQHAKEASKEQKTQAIGNSLDQKMSQKKAHQDEYARLCGNLKDLEADRAAIEEELKRNKRHANTLQKLDDAEKRLDAINKDENHFRAELKRTMSSAWRSLLREPVNTARMAAEEAVRQEREILVSEIRRLAIETGQCGACLQDVNSSLREQLRTTLQDDSERVHPKNATKLRELSGFEWTDNTGEIRQIWTSLKRLRLEKASLRANMDEWSQELSEVNHDAIRRTESSFKEILAKIFAVQQAIEKTNDKIDEKEREIQQLNRNLEKNGTANLKPIQTKYNLLNRSSEVFSEAINIYKQELRQQVETTATKLFLSMTTEKHDYKGLEINTSYGLTIKHKDGDPVNSRSAGAEHVVALALMGALQNSAPLRGPIVMDSPFGRLDELHTINVVRTLPEMAEQAILLVYRTEVDQNKLREVLGSKLLREYELGYVSARRTNILPLK